MTLTTLVFLGMGSSALGNEAFEQHCTGTDTFDDTVDIHITSSEDIRWFRGTLIDTEVEFGVTGHGVVFMDTGGTDYAFQAYKLGQLKSFEPWAALHAVRDLHPFFEQNAAAIPLATSQHPLTTPLAMTNTFSIGFSIYGDGELGSDLVFSTEQETGFPDGVANTDVYFYPTSGHVPPLALTARTDIGETVTASFWDESSRFLREATWSIEDRQVRRTLTCSEPAPTDAAPLAAKFDAVHAYLGDELARSSSEEEAHLIQGLAASLPAPVHPYFSSEEAGLSNDRVRVCTVALAEARSKYQAALQDPMFAQRMSTGDHFDALIEAWRQAIVAQMDPTRDAEDIHGAKAMCMEALQTLKTQLEQG